MARGQMGGGARRRMGHTAHFDASKGCHCPTTVERKAWEMLDREGIRGVALASGCLHANGSQASKQPRRAIRTALRAQ